MKSSVFEITKRCHPELELESGFENPRSEVGKERCSSFQSEDLLRSWSKPWLGVGGRGFEGSREKLVDRLAVLSSPWRTRYSRARTFFVLGQTIIQRVERREKQRGQIRIWDL